MDYLYEQFKSALGYITALVNNSTILLSTAMTAIFYASLHISGVHNSKIY